VLRSIEQKIESIFEGVFGRAFRANVQPVELARKLVKEMDDHRLVSVSRVYVPNEYTIYLSPEDREQFSTYEASLRAELQDYLVEHARREGYAVLTAPAVFFRTDDDLDLGEFGIATRMAQRERSTDGEPAAASEPGATMVYRPKEPLGATEAASSAELGVEAEEVSLTVAGERHMIDKRRVVIGRSKECDVQVQDPNVSRQHAELRQEGTAYWLVDLESTNGTEVNGQREKRAKLESGDKIMVGSTELLFERTAVPGSVGNG
jgi:FHA domain-containing protein